MRGFLAAPETRVAVVGWRQFLAKVNQVADSAHRAGQTEYRVGEHRRQRALPARGTTRVGHRAHRLGQTFGTAQRPGQRSEGPRLFSGQRRQRIGRTCARVRAPGAQPESLRRAMRHVRVIAAPRETGRAADLNPARGLIPGAGVTGRIHDSVRRSGSTPVRSRPCAGRADTARPNPRLARLLGRTFARIKTRLFGPSSARRRVRMRPAILSTLRAPPVSEPPVSPPRCSSPSLGPARENSSEKIGKPWSLPCARRLAVRSPAAGGLKIISALARRFFSCNVDTS